MRQEVRKIDRMCIVCGTTFKGTEASVTCGAACRIRLVRLKKANRRPEFILIAKGKGQKIPDLNAPKRLKYGKGEKKIVIQDLNEQSKGTTKDFNELPKQENVAIEVPEQQVELSKEQKLIKISELNAEILKITKEGLPPGMLPKRHTLDKSMRIDEINEQINLLK